MTDHVILFRIRELRPHENQIYQIQSHNTFVCCRIDAIRRCFMCCIHLKNDFNISQCDQKSKKVQFLARWNWFLLLCCVVFDEMFFKFRNQWINFTIFFVFVLEHCAYFSGLSSKNILLYKTFMHEWKLFIFGETLFWLSNK